MSTEDATLKLYSLTSRQREILQLFCEGNNYKQIAETLVISENTVKSHMGHIYVKLGLDMLDDAQRKKTLHQGFCAALGAIDVSPPKPDEPKELAPIPEYVWKMVEEDEKAIMIRPSNQIIDITPSSGITHPQPKPPKRFRWFLFGVVIGSILMGIITIGLMRINDFLKPINEVSIPIPTSTVALITEELSPRPLPTYTALPTYTPYPTQVIATQEETILTEIPNPDEQIPPPGSIIPAGQSFSKSGLTVVTNDYVQKEYDLIRFEFSIYNDRGNPYTLRFRTSELHLKDNLGNDYPLRTRDGLQVYEKTFEKTHKVSFAYFSPMWFSWNIPIDATQLIFTIDEIAGMKDLNWVFNLQ